MEDISDKMEDPAMDPVEEEIVAGAQAHYDRRDYQQLKSFIFVSVRLSGDRTLGVGPPFLRHLCLLRGFFL